MRNVLAFGLVVFWGVVIIFGITSCDGSQSKHKKPERVTHFPYEEFFMMKNYPQSGPNPKEMHKVMGVIAKSKSSHQNRVGTWVNEGPANIGGRINTIGVNPQNPDEFMFGYSLGGIFKTTNQGDHWEPIFDDLPTSSISDIVYHPDDPNIIFVGTGDHNISGYPVNGDGIYKTTDGGDTWSYLGLREAGVISEIGISSSPDTIYAASMGIPFLRTPDRGLYKSVDGGTTWEKVLFVNDSTGVIDIEVHPTNPDIVYATTWTRIRNNRESTLISESAGIYRTMDGGNTWERLSNGLPSGNLVRPGLAMCKSNPDIIYAVFVDEDFQWEGIYKTQNGGDDWERVAEPGQSDLAEYALGGFGWYFGQIRVDPGDPQKIFLLGVGLYMSQDGGSTWEQIDYFGDTPHADKHDLVFAGDRIILATDGGGYLTDANDLFWKDCENNTTLQVYRLGKSKFEEGRYYAGAQDNGTNVGNSTSGIDNWAHVYGGDGFQSLFHPFNPDVYYFETQNGRISITRDGGISFSAGGEGLEGKRNWDMQYIMSPFDPEVLYTGTDRIYISRSDSTPYWIPISGILTDTLEPSSAYSHTMSTLDQSPLDEDVLYCGMSDGYIWRTLDGGDTWDRINGDLARRYVSDIKASPHDAGTVYASLQGYKDNDNTPHIYKSTDFGDTWVSIQGDMPHVAVNDILIPDFVENSIFLGTDAGVFYTNDGGIEWTLLGDNMPLVPVYDLDIHEVDGNKILAAGTFARGVFTFDLAQLEDLAVEGGAPKNKISFFPNPASDNIYIRNATNLNGSIRIIDLSGRVVQNLPLRNTDKIDVRDIPVGEYALQITTGNEPVTHKLVILR